jgi:hypothetical protein
MRGQKPGKDHPNYRTGKWAGEKAKYAAGLGRKVPRTGVTARVREWANQQRHPFTSDDLAAVMPELPVQKISDALSGLSRRNIIKQTGRWIGHCAVWEVIQ